MSTDVWEEHIASILRGEEHAEQETNVKAGGNQIQPDSSQLSSKFVLAV
jgi:hypothetical protein